jgi:hypothetical protein
MGTENIEPSKARSGLYSMNPPKSTRKITLGTPFLTTDWHGFINHLPSLSAMARQAKNTKVHEKLRMQNEE